MSAVPARVQRLLGADVVSTTPVAGGGICTARRLRLRDDRSVLVKTLENAPADFFAAEARGLGWLRAARGVEVPDVLAVDDDFLIVSWIEPGPAGPEAAARFGRDLAALHAAGAPRFGASRDGYIGTAPLFNEPADSWPQFWVDRRILPYLAMASDQGAIAPADVAVVERAMNHVAELAGEPEPPSRLHGDLWSGNIVWGKDGVARLVDPAAYGGHRESDLAVLALFGAPYLDRILAAYDEAAPLGDGWRDRVALHQLYPLLVHAVHFGGSYGARAGSAARGLLRGRAAHP